MHFVYKDESLRLNYRHFDGSAFGPRMLVEGMTDWATQPAITRMGGSLYVFYNRVRELNRRYELRVRVLKNGTLSAPGGAGLAGHLQGLPQRGGRAALGQPARSPASSAMRATPTPGARCTEWRWPAAAVPSERRRPATPQRPGPRIFGDEFSRRVSRGLGSPWTVHGLVVRGRHARGERPGWAGPGAGARRSLWGLSVEVRVQHFSEAEAGVVLRAQGSARYSLVFMTNGRHPGAARGVRARHGAGRGAQWPLVRPRAHDADAVGAGLGARGAHRLGGWAGEALRGGLQQLRAPGAGAGGTHHAPSPGCGSTTSRSACHGKTRGSHLRERIQVQPVFPERARSITRSPPWTSNQPGPPPLVGFLVLPH